MSPSERNPDCTVARAAMMVLLWLAVSTPASGQADPDQPQSRGVIVLTPGQTYTERVDIPSTSQEQQEAELAAQRPAGCSTKVLDPKTLALLEPYLNGLIAQSNYLSTHLGGLPTRLRPMRSGRRSIDKRRGWRRAPPLSIKTSRRQWIAPWPTS